MVVEEPVDVFPALFFGDGDRWLGRGHGGDPQAGVDPAVAEPADKGVLGGADAGRGLLVVLEVVLGGVGDVDVVRVEPGQEADGAEDVVAGGGGRGSGEVSSVRGSPHAAQHVPVGVSADEVGVGGG